jgi:hypothetical protein
VARSRPTDVRDLRGVLEREESASLAGFISLREPTAAMRREAEEAGVFEYQGVGYPLIQLLTVRELLEEHREFQKPQPGHDENHDRAVQPRADRRTFGQRSAIGKA